MSVDLDKILTFLIEFYTYPLFEVQNTIVTPRHFVVAIGSIVIAVILARLTTRFLERRVLKRFGLDPGVEFALLQVVHYVIVIIGIYMGLSTLALPLNWLIAFMSLLGVGIGFGLQNLVSNFISGIILLFERPIKLHDRITVADMLGDVAQINLRTTVINTIDNISIIVPNSKLLEENLINWSYGDRRIRIHVPVGVAYGSDTALVKRILIQAADEHELVLKNPAPDVLFLEFGDSSLNFDLICWLPDSKRQPNVLSDLNFRIDQLFRENGVEIPFPQRDLHIRSDATKPPPA